MELKEARCTNCGAHLNLEPQKTMATCDYCHSTIMVSNAVELALVEVDKTKDLERYRSLLKDAIQKNSIGEILRQSNQIKDIIPSDFTANYYFAYAKQSGNEPSFMKAFLNSTLPATPEEINDVVNHMIHRSDLRDKPVILSFLTWISPESIARYEEAHKNRARQENQYANVKRDVFICHSSHDRAVAEKIVETLEKEGFTCWISTRNLRPEDSENYWENIKKAIKNTKLFLVVSSESAMLSKDVQREIEISQERKQKRFEYKMDDTPQTVLFKHAFDGIKWVDGSESPINHVKKLPNRVYEELYSLSEISDEVKYTENKQPENLITNKNEKAPVKVNRFRLKWFYLGGLILTLTIIFIFIFRTQVYTVEYLNIDGETIEVFEVEEGLRPPEIDAPEIEGYEFIRWIGSSSNVQSNLVISPDYKELEQYTIVYNFMDGSDNLIASVYEGSTVNAPSYSREGYLLDGWYTSLNNGQTFDESWSFSQNIPTSDLNLYAKWNPLEYELNFESNFNLNISSESINYDTPLDSLPSPIREGYTFSGWFLDPSYQDRVDGISMPSRDLTLYAKWRINEYKLSIFGPNETLLEEKLVPFKDSINLSAISTPDIDNHSFYEWPQFNYERMPARDISIGAIYVDYSPFEYEISLDSISIIGYDQSYGPSVIIPKTIDGNRVESIGEGAFESKEIDNVRFHDLIYEIDNHAFYNNKLTEVILPENLLSVGAYAFRDNQISYLVFNENLESIYQFAFDDNELTEISLPENIDYISWYAFRNNNIKEIFIPENLRYLGRDAFSRNPIEDVIIEGDQSRFIDSWLYHGFPLDLIWSVTPNSIVINENILFNSESQNIIAHLDETIKDINIPSHINGITVRGIANSVFEYFFTLESVDLPDTLKIIGDFAFHSTNLSTIIFPDGLEEIGGYAFNHTKLSEIELPQSLEHIDFRTFYSNQLTSVIIPDNVRTIAHGAFEANNLTSITIPENVHYIGGNAFLDNPITSVIFEGGEMQLEYFYDQWEEIGFPAELKPEE